MERSKAMVVFVSLALLAMISAEKSNRSLETMAAQYRPRSNEASISILAPQDVQVTQIADLLGRRTLSWQEAEAGGNSREFAIIRDVPNEARMNSTRRTVFMVYFEGPADRQVYLDLEISWDCRTERFKPLVRFDHHGLAHFSLGVDPVSKIYLVGKMKGWLVANSIQGGKIFAVGD